MDVGKEKVCGHLGTKCEWNSHHHGITILISEIKGELEEGKAILPFLTRSMLHELLILTQQSQPPAQRESIRVVRIRRGWDAMPLI